MESIWNLIVRGATMIGVIYLAVATVALAALLKISWDRRKWAYATVECPACGGQGVVEHDDEWDLCSLCDGECALVERVELGAGE